MDLSQHKEFLSDIENVIATYKETLRGLSAFSRMVDLPGTVVKRVVKAMDREFIRVLEGLEDVHARWDGNDYRSSREAVDLLPNWTDIGMESDGSYFVPDLVFNGPGI